MTDNRIAVNVYISSAPEDEVYLKDLKTYLAPLCHQGSISIWHNGDIDAGTEWEREVKQHLDVAEIILLLISPYFMDSDHCYGIEMQHVLNQHEYRGTPVIPVLVRSCAWKDSSLTQFNMLPKSHIPVTDSADSEAVFCDIAEEVGCVAEDLLRKRWSDVKKDLNDLQQREKALRIASKRIQVRDGSSHVSQAQQVAQIIKEAREEKDLTQAQLAELMDVADDRTVRMWESGERSPTQAHRQAIVRILDIQAELLGLEEQTYFSLEKALLFLKNVESFFEQGYLTSALSNADLLVRNLARQVKHGDAGLLMLLIRALYLRGLAVSIVENNPPLALNDFEEIERLASQIGDQTWLCVAWMYQAEMYRRMREYQQARLIFTKVAEELTSDSRVISHYQQLLARVDIALNDIEAAMKAMGEAEKHALTSQEQSSNFSVFFDLCSVYIDYANIHMKSGNIALGRDYIARAEKITKRAPYWSPLIHILKGTLLMNMAAHTGNGASKSILDDPDYLKGKRLFAKGYKLAKKYGDQRLVQRAHSLVNSFGQRGNRNIRIAQDLEESFHDGYS